MVRRCIVVAVFAALASTMVPAQAAPITCVLAGKANFSPGVKTAKQNVSYSFNGKLSNCQGGPKSGNVAANGAGSFSCSAGKSAGTALISWVNGQTSSAWFTTNNTAAVVRIGGTITSGLNAGSKITGAILFEANAVLCATSGLPSATFHGAVRAG